MDAVDLLDSIKKQRDLFTRTLSTADMPNKLSLKFEDPINVESTRRPLSPRNKKGGVSDTTQLVSSLRNKREDLVKRYEQANLPSERKTTAFDASGDGKRTFEQENLSSRASLKKKPVVDLSFLDQSTTSVDATIKRISKPADPPRRKIQQHVFTVGGYEEKNVDISEPGLLAQAKSQLKKTSGASQAFALESQSKGVTRAVATSNKGANTPWKKDTEKADACSKPGDALAKTVKTMNENVPRSFQVPITAKLKSPSEARKSIGSINTTVSRIKTEKEDDNDCDADKPSVKVHDASWIKKKDEQNQNEQQHQKNALIDNSWIGKGAEAINLALKVDATASRPRLSLGAERIVDRKALFEPASAKKNDSKEEKKTFTAARKSLFETPKHQPAGHGRNTAPANTLWIRKQEFLLAVGTETPSKSNVASNKNEIEDRKKSTEPSSWIKRKTEDDEKEEQSLSNVGIPISSARIKYEAQTSRTNRETMLGQISAPGLHCSEKKKPTNAVQEGIRKQPLSISDKKDHLDVGLKTPKTLTSSKLIIQTDRKRVFASAKGAPPEWLRSPILKQVKVESASKDDSKTFETCYTEQEKQLDLNAKVKMFDKNCDSPKKTSRYFWEVSESSSPKRGRCLVTPKPNIAASAKISSSVIHKMEKVALGQEPVEINDAGDGHEQVGVSEADLVPEATTSLDPYSEAEVFEYGDPNFSFTDIYYGCDESSENGFVPEYDDASEGSTYKVDNYQKDFIASIPMQSPWQHLEEQPEAYDESCKAQPATTMKIVSIAPSGSNYEEPGVDPHPFCLKPHDSIVEECTSRNIFICRSHNHKPRSTNNAEADHAHDERNCQREEVDPIFQVRDFDPQNKTTRGFISFLSKPTEQEDQAKSSKGYFQILKRGVGSTVGKEDAVVDEREDISEGGSNARTTLSSITRSVHSNPGESGSNKSGDSKPLGVLNGFFKAARKLQKKRKSKFGRGRSLSNRPPIGRYANEVKPPQNPLTKPPTEVQLWPAKDKIFDADVPDSMPPQMMATNINANAGRRFGAYGGQASNRSKTLDTSSLVIQSLASW